jgi:hypothetical protein
VDEEMNEIPRKDLDIQQFMQLRQATQKIGSHLEKRLKLHTEILKPLFSPRKLLGNYIQSASNEEVLGSEKAFSSLQERYSAVCEKPFGLPRKLSPPLSPIATQLECSPFQYDLVVPGSQDKPTVITSPVRWILFFKCECDSNQLRDMVRGEKSRQPDEIKKSLISHLTMAVMLDRFPNLVELLTDLRYIVEIHRFDELGGLQAVMLKAPLEAFLPSNEFILQTTQLSGIRAFQEIIDPEAVANLRDPLKQALQKTVAG